MNMEMILRASAARVDGQRDRLIRYGRATVLAHDFASLPGLPEEVRRQRFKQQRAFSAVDTVGWHQQILQRAIAVLKQDIAALQVHFRAGRGIVILLLMRDALLQNNVTQRVTVAGMKPVVAASHRRHNHHHQR